MSNSSPYYTKIGPSMVKSIHDPYAQVFAGGDTRYNTKSEVQTLVLPTISFVVSSLPAASSYRVGHVLYASNGRKLLETPGNGTGVPVYSNGTNWLTFYGNSTVTA